MEQDGEIKAMGDVATALSTLDNDAVKRVLRWAGERYRVSTLPSGKSQVVGDGVEVDDTGQSATREYSSFPELFDAANPTTGPDKALVVGYWFQVVRAEEDLDGFTLNKELRNLGHPSSNITRDLDALINRTPRYVLQVRKEGNSRQARKKYRLTREGIRSVQGMLGGIGHNE